MENHCDILKSKLILCKWNAFYFIEIAFIGLALDEIKHAVYSFFWDTRYKQNISNEAGRTRPDFSRPILIGSYNYADVKSKQFDIDRFQSAD